MLTNTITPEMLDMFVRTGVAWAPLYRSGATLADAEAYAYSGTLVFQVGADDDGMFLLAMVRGVYTRDQLARYATGLWGVPTGAYDTRDQAQEALVDMVIGRW